MFFWGQKECDLVPDYCCPAEYVLSQNQLPLLEADIHPRWWKSETRPFLLFPAEQRPPSSAWRPAALTLLLLCLVLLIGLAVLGCACKSALWLGGGSWPQGLCGKRNICYGIFLHTLILEPANNSIYLILKYLFKQWVVEEALKYRNRLPARLLHSLWDKKFFIPLFIFQYLKSTTFNKLMLQLLLFHKRVEAVVLARSTPGSVG